MDKALLTCSLFLLMTITIVDGAQSGFVSMAFMTGFEIILLLQLLFCSNLSEFKELMGRYRWIWLLLLLILIFGILQILNFGPFNAYDKYAAYHKLHLYLGYVGFLLLMCLQLNSIEKIRLVIAAVVVVAVAQTLFGMMNYYTKEMEFGWIPTHYAFHRVTGTYINRNFYSNYVAMTLGFCLIPLLFIRSAQSRKELDQSMESKNWAMQCGQGLVSVLLISGVLLSGSRSAVVAIMCGMILVIFFIFRDKQVRFRFVPIAVVVVSAVTAFGINLFSKRILVVTESASERFVQWKSTWQLILERPAVGYGTGSYEPVFKTGEAGVLSSLTYTHAHNDYLELLLEQGFIVFTALLLITILILKIVVNGIWSKSFSKKKIFLAVLFGMTGMLIHALFDFPFQIPANVILYLLLVAIALSVNRLTLRAGQWIYR